MSTKTIYQQQLQSQLTEWDKQISDLKEKADHASDYDAKADYNGQVEHIHALQQTARDKLNELKNAHENKWDHLKEDIESTWEKLETAIKKITSTF